MSEARMVAAILAGGAGSRMGGDKAMQMLAGQPLAAHVARALAGADALAVVGDARAAQALGAADLRDSPGAPAGPLAGVLAALDWARAEGAAWLALAPCDAPFLPDNLLSQLHAAAGAAPLVCVRSAAGVESLLGLWSASLAPRLQAALAGGVHPPVHTLLAAWGAAELRLGAEQVMNVNTPADLARAEALLATR